MPFLNSWRIAAASWGRFAGWWAGVSGIYAASGNGCPCCGAPGCPVGAASAGFLGLLCAFVLSKYRAKIAGVTAEQSGEETAALLEQLNVSGS